MIFPQLGMKVAQVKRWLQLGAVAATLLGGAAGVAFAWPQASVGPVKNNLALIESTGWAPAAAIVTVRQTDVTLPILFYHYPPPDFEQQLEHLEQTGYTVVSMDQVLAGLRGAALPPKPVAITFDDGFAQQWEAFEILKRHQMKATFYIIGGGEASQWCIGAGRRYGDALQPPEGCGDDYLTWEQIRALDRSDLITIGGHTLNHLNLTTLPEPQQRREILTGKQLVETRLGHRILHFAYPYGAHDEQVARLAGEAGYQTGVTTEPGDVQPGGEALTLRRVRDAWALP